MADNVGITPGTGATAAADDIGGVLFQRVKVVHGADGTNDGDVAAGNPLPVAGYGELVEALEAIRMAVHSLTRTIGIAQPNANSQPILEVRQATAANLLATVSQGTASSLQMTATLAANQTLGTLNNLASIGGVAGVLQVHGTMAVAASAIRQNITVT